MDKLADMGEDAPDFFEWLATKNPYFMTAKEWNKGNNQNYDNMSFAEKKKYLKKNNIWNEISVVRDEHIRPPAYMRYKNREILWILNNNVSRINSMPGWLEDAKSVYIVDHTATPANYAETPSMEDDWDTTLDTYTTGVTVFIYTHHTFLRNVKGLRRTYFQGYNEPQTFQMEDYNILPPMEDFRRTIYWNPNVKTDSEGKATIEFYNNSSCTEMFISAEGMTKDGRFVVY